MELIYFIDSSHGWLRVELKDIPKCLDISKYSYTDGVYAYLEEDSDATRFIATQPKGSLRIIERVFDGECFIRDLKDYA